ncbi:hypothetical protein PENTCL1PPCAC_3036, partial [Pristionchus entomophagus]
FTRHELSPQRAMLLPLLTLLLLVLPPSPISANQPDPLCSSPPRPIAAPTHADAVYFLFVIDNSWPEHKIAQQKALYRMIACQIPRSAEYRVGTIYAYAPQRAKDLVLDDKSLVTADRFTTTLDDVVERSYLSRARLPYDGSRCARMHAVLDAVKLADFSYDHTVHTHYIFPTDDSEDDLVNDCDPAWTFKQSARNILKDSTPNHLYLDVIRVGTAKRWTQYGERVQLADWSDRSIIQKDVSLLFAGFLDGALRGDAVNDAIVFATNGLERYERPKDLMSFVTEPLTPPPSTTTTSTSTSSAPPPPTSTPAAAPAAIFRSGRGLRGTAFFTTPPSQEVERESDPADTVEGLLERSPRDLGNETMTNSTDSRNCTKGEEKGKEGYSVLGYQTPFSKTTFFIVVIATTAGAVLLVWLVCGLVFYCCYREDDSLKKHDNKEEEEEEEQMLISGLNEHDWEKPSTILISDHLKKCKEDRYNEEQLKSVDARGTISMEV